MTSPQDFQQKHRPIESKVLDQIPVLHVRGTHFEVGFAIGRQFRSMIDEILRTWGFFNEILLPTYEMVPGKEIYDKTLELCGRKFPNYVAELQGIAQGAQVPFYKLFLMHLESVMVPPNTERDFLERNQKEKAGIGCTSIMCKFGDVQLLGHTEDTSPEFANNVYIVFAEVLDESGEILEKFSTLTYPGHLPGYTMGFNTHGLIYSVNTLYPRHTHPGKTPRTFIARGVLGCSNMEQVIHVLRDEGSGTSDGFSINVGFVSKNSKTETSIWKNIEIAPGNSQSELDIFALSSANNCYAHCNRYMRLQTLQLGDPEFNSSCMRLKVFEKYKEKLNKIETLEKLLGDQSDSHFPIFRNATNPDLSKTVAVGIFNVKNRTWSIYTKPPSYSSPIAVLPLEFN